MPVNTFCLEKSSQVGGWGKEVIVFRAVVDKSKNIAAGVKKLEKCFKRTNSKGLTHSKIYSSLCPSILSHSLPLSLSPYFIFIYYYILCISIITFFFSLSIISFSHYVYQSFCFVSAVCVFSTSSFFASWEKIGKQNLALSRGTNCTQGTQMLIFKIMCINIM